MLFTSMRNKAMTKLTDTQLIVLSSAAKHDEGLATRPEPGRVNDGIHVSERGAHVLRSREVPDNGARLQRNDGGTTQQYAQPITALRQFVQQVLSNEPGCAGQRDKWSAGRHLNLSRELVGV
jgi:hypothetical protein